MGRGGGGAIDPGAKVPEALAVIGAGGAIAFPPIEEPKEPEPNTEEVLAEAGGREVGGLSAAVEGLAP